VKANWIAAVAAGLCFAARAPAQPMEWQGTLRFDFAAGIADAAITGTGVADVTRAGGARLVSLDLAGGITGDATAPATDPAIAQTLRSAMATVTLGSGALAPLWPPAPSGPLRLERGVLPVRGLLRLCFLVEGCAIGPFLPLTRNEGNTGFGAGGLLTIGAGATDFAVSVEAAPWTLGTATLPIRTENGATFAIPRVGFAHGPLSYTGSTALAGGVLQLVSPLAVTSPSGQAFASFGVLQIRLIPEPGPLVLLAPGILGMWVLGRRRGS